LYVYTSKKHWGCLPEGHLNSIRHSRKDLSFQDAVRHHYSSRRCDATTGVTIGVIDTGVDLHSDLNIIDRRNTVTGENASQVDDWNGHGTHVAGISSNPPPRLALIPFATEERTLRKSESRQARRMLGIDRPVSIRADKPVG
jgi:hypothetical protein